MFKSEEENLQKELMELREENKALKQKIAELEGLTDEQASTLEAQESVNDLARMERIFAESTIKAYEKVIELSRQELKESKAIIDAQNHLNEFSREKKAFLDATIEAFNRVLALSSKELDEAYKTINAYENIQDMARTELLDAFEHLRGLTDKK